MSDKTDNFKKPYYEKEDSRHPDSAMPEFMAHELFGELIPPSASHHILTQLGRRTATAWFGGNLGGWSRRVITAFELLQRVPREDFPKLVQIVSLTVQSYYAPQKSAYFTGQERKEKKKASEPEERFPALFHEYLHDFENVYRHVATIFAFAKEAVFGQTQTVRPATWWLNQSAKTKASKLDTPLSIGKGLPLQILVEGYDRHYRNAIAHIRYRFIDRDRVEMWDVNEKGGETWRQTLTYDTCEEKLKLLSATISVMEAAYFLFEMNNSSELVAATANVVPAQMSTEERHNLIYIVAKESYNLDVVDIQDESGSLHIVAKIIPNFTIPQTSKLYIGGDSGAMAYDIEQTVESVPLNRVALGYFRMLRRGLGELKQLTLNVQDETGKDSGTLTLQHDHIEFLATADERMVPPENIPVVENSLQPILVKFTRRGRPRPSRPKPSALVLPPRKKIIIP